MGCYCKAGAVCLASLVLAGPFLPNSPAHGQAHVRPGDRRPELEPFAPEAPPPESLELPPIPQPRDTRPGPFSAGVEIHVEAFRVEGNTVFPTEELELLVAPYSGRVINSEDLLRAREAITQHYIEHGYRTSGAVIPDQEIVDGVVTIRVVEGVLSAVRVEGTRRFRPGYFRTRLRRAGRAPVNVFTLEEQLQRFQRDPRVKRIRARLLPGSHRGESELTLEVEEERFYGLLLAFANDNTPAIGSNTLHVEPAIANLIGYGDVLGGRIQISEGLRRYEARFDVTLPPFDTRIVFEYRRSESQVVEAPFDELEIHSQSETLGGTLSQPFYLGRSGELLVGATFQYRTSETEILDECFAFVPDTSECEVTVSVLRLFGAWTWATPRNVIAARSTLSVGLDAFGSTQRDSPLPDSEFLAWLGQAQWAHRLPDSLLNSELIARVDVQTASEALVGIEKFAVGGMRTVRGYRENQFVRDNGVVASLELRIPLLRDRRGRSMVELAPFVDYGHSWNDGPVGELFETIASVGIGLRVSPWEWLQGEFYWGGRLKEAPTLSDDPQNHGIHFAVRITSF
ncbi:MAG: ShlB/FhaC/HecB family hemolysin secretion/activation protein [Deltaproteobacteria bacterium]|nr:ShlB/FhaC/HecB family hemolysin secretion/activation protein [Deltaproteobacteria bacterium]